MTEETRCPYNSGVDCPPNERNCMYCGWSPDVAARRMAAVRAGVTEPAAPRPAIQGWRRVVKRDKYGRIVAEYSSIGAAAKATGMTRAAMLYRCDGLKVKADPDGCTYQFKD